jgi:hypothetical protein
MLAAALSSLLIAIAGLILAMTLARRKRHRREAEAAQFDARWAPLLYARMDNPEAPLARLEPGETVLFLSLWLRILGFVRGEAETALGDAAVSLGITPAALGLLKSRDPGERLLAIRAAGVLGLSEAVPWLKDEIRRCDHRTALVAISALFRIDPQAASAALHAQLAVLIWSPSALARLLAPAGEQALALLAKELAQAPARRALRLTRVIDALSSSAALPILRDRIHASRNKEEIAILIRALGRVGAEPDRELARGMLGDADPLVRMQAAACLGQLGAEPDAEALIPLLRDSVWWVRYRAAGAIARLLRPSQARLRELIDAETDRYGGEILARAAAETARKA